MRARTFTDVWDMDSGFIGSVLERMISDSSARPVHTLKTNSCNTLFPLALKSFHILDFFPRMSWLETHSDSGSVSRCGHRWGHSNKRSVRQCGFGWGRSNGGGVSHCSE